MEQWGESLFRQIFETGNPLTSPSAYYQEAVRQGLEHCELCVSSEAPAFLNVPWELMRDPTPGRGYLAPSLAGFYRQRTGQKIEADPELSAEGPFRILLVIARPFGKLDVPLGTVARPMLDALRPLRPRMQLEVLRPPTFDAFQKLLNDRRGYYHLVHFDGHGVFARPSAGTLFQFGAKADAGHLVFEKADGTAQVVNSQDLGQVLNTCKVPLFVLNACQSAEEGRSNPFSSVASQLVAIGAKAVVAMSYSVYASTAAQFVKRFYECLIRHCSLADAVAAGRKNLYSYRERDSVVGPIELHDWIVPVLYQKESGYVPIPKGTTLAAAEEEKEKTAEPKGPDQTCQEGRFGFIGRDYDVLRIERGLRNEKNPFVLLHGMGGVGKTELAFGFARWFWETSGCPGGVFVTSFKEKADIGQVMGSIVGFATDFSRLPYKQQWNHLVGYLRENPCLLIWDNFETVAGYPEGAEPLATSEDRAELSRFLKGLRGGKSRVAITTRKTDEGWLGIAYEPVELSGLTARDGSELAKAILRTVGRKPEEFRDDPDYSELIKLLKGHPRSIEVVLPNLRTRSPRDLIDALQHRVDQLGESLEDASLAYAFSQMSAQTRKHLPFIGLFGSFVYANILGLFVGAGGRSQQTYQETVGQVLDVKGWEDVLDEAGRCGLLGPRGGGLCEMHPTLAPFLRRQLLSATGEQGLKRLDSEFMKFYAAWAGTFSERVDRSDPKAIGLVEVEESNLLRAIRLAETKEEWRTAQAIAQLFGDFYECVGRADEWRALRTRLLSRVGRDVSRNTERDQANLWMYLLGSEADDSMRRGQLATAEQAYKRILGYLVSLSDPEVEPKIATAYHQLGRIAEERQQFDQAEAWYRKALEIKERLGHPPLMVNTLAQLGVLRRRQNQLSDSILWFGRAHLIAAEYNMPVGARILLEVGRLMTTMGENDFTAAWRQAFKGQEPPLEAIREILKRSKDEA
ncbi:MAG: CHAT domain-containing protein [Candidatus Zixiibacteriota bacterium]